MIKKLQEKEWREWLDLGCVEVLGLEESKKAKARLCVAGQHEPDAQQGPVRTDAPTMQRGRDAMGTASSLWRRQNKVRCGTGSIRSRSRLSQQVRKVHSAFPFGTWKSLKEFIEGRTELIDLTDSKGKAEDTPVTDCKSLYDHVKGWSEVQRRANFDGCHQGRDSMRYLVKRRSEGEN
mmetsp:Transcript_53293/g.124828  ORF Transcript_53293/g.124828 Transcript_53293/m.124828 type:complete len:178 (+) Transcript_53293:142-675(+)